MDASGEFRGKKITLMGLGLLGRGVGDAKYLAECGAELIVTDQKSAEELAPSVALLKDFPNVTLRLGAHDPSDFSGRDLVIYGPKTPKDSPYLAEAVKNGIRTTMSSALFARLAGIPVVGVTGTRGKTTTTEMIAKGLRDAGTKVILGGNIRGVSTLAQLPDVTPDTVAVLELDSWQLQGFRDEKLSPHIAVFTNLMPDHRDYYADEAAYFADKAGIFEFQKKGDTLISGRAVTTTWILPYIQEKGLSIAPIVPEKLPEDWKLKVLGWHNAENASLAREALHALGLEDTAIRASLESFEAIEGRLQHLRDVDGIAVYNDNNATTPTATAAALEAVSHYTGVVLIAGGSDKNLPLTMLSDFIRARAKAVVLLPGTGTDRLMKKLESVENMHQVTSMKEAVAVARAAATTGDAILFSPAFASFGLFKNEYDRNDQFVAAANAL